MNSALRMVVRWAEKRGWVVEFDSGKLHKMMDQKIVNCAHGSILSTTYNVANKVLKENKKHDEGSWRFGSTMTLEALPFRLPRSKDFKRYQTLFTNEKEVILEKVILWG